MIDAEGLFVAQVTADPFILMVDCSAKGLPLLQTHTLLALLVQKYKY